MCIIFDNKDFRKVRLLKTTKAAKQQVTEGLEIDLKPVEKEPGEGPEEGKRSSLKPFERPQAEPQEGARRTSLKPFEKVSVGEPTEADKKSLKSFEKAKPEMKEEKKNRFLRPVNVAKTEQVEPETAGEKVELLRDKPGKEEKAEPSTVKVEFWIEVIERLTAHLTSLQLTSVTYWIAAGLV